MNTLLVLALQSLLVLLLVDFFAGLIHWAEDAYVLEDTPFVGTLLGRPNLMHHHFPRHMTRNTWLQSSWDLALFAAGLVLVAWLMDWLTWHVWLFAVLSANANEVHKWSHRTRRENGPVISFGQRIRLLQTPQHHAIHHTNPKNTYYCPVTNLLNPLLEKLHFWESLEWLLAHTLGLRRRADTSLPGHGPAPAWLADVQRPTQLQLPVRGKSFQREAANLRCAGSLPENFPAHGEEFHPHRRRTAAQLEGHHAGNPA